MMRTTGIGRFSVDLIVANNRDVVNLADGESVLDKVKHVLFSGVVDSGARDSFCRNGSWTISS